MFGTSFHPGNASAFLKKSNGLRRGFACVLTVAMLCSGMVFAPTPAQATGSGVTQHYSFEATADVEENEAQLGTNLYFGANVTSTQKNKARFVYTDGQLALEDGLQKNVVIYNLMSGVGTVADGDITDPANHYGVGEEFRLLYPETDGGGNVEDGEDNGAGESGTIKAPKEMLKVYLNEMDELDTDGLGAVNLSLVCGFFAPSHNHSSNVQSNESNVGVEKQLKVFASLDGETWLSGSVGVRSSTLMGGGYLSKSKGLNGVFYRVETEDLLSIPGVAGQTIKKIMFMPFGESQRTSGEFRISELAVNAYDEEDDFLTQVPSDVTYINVDGDTLRQIAVEEALRTAQTEWTTEEEVKTYVGSTACHYYPLVPWDKSAPIVHHGPTYEQRLDSTRELFQSQIVDGVWTGGYAQRDADGNETDEVFGMDCQTFVFNAVSRVSRSYAWSCTHTPNAPYTSIVGPHLNVTELPRHTDQDILDPSDAQAVYEAYSLTEAGDIVDSYGFGLGHTRLVKSSHTVYVPAEGGYFDQISAPEYAFVGEGKGEYILENGVYTRVPRVDGFRRGDYDRVEEGEYQWVGAGQGSYNIDPDQSSVVCTHQASVPRYAFRKTTYGTDEQGDPIVTDVRDTSVLVTASQYKFKESQQIAQPPLIQQGYELQYSYSSRDNDEFTFARLKETGYAPFTLDEYTDNRVEEQNVQAVLGSEVVGKRITEGGAETVVAISSNYRLISYELDLIRVDSEGDPVGDPLYSTGLRYIMEANIMTQALRGATTDELNAALDGLPNGKYRINLSVDSGPITELGEDEVPRTVIPFDFEITGRRTEISNGDVFYIPSACSAGSTVEAYVIHSASGANAVGDVITMTFPADNIAYTSGDTSYAADGKPGATGAHFWQMLDGTLYAASGTWYKGTGSQKFQFGYHDKITGIVGNDLYIADATGHVGSSSTNCKYSYKIACGIKSGTNSHYECAGKLTIPTGQVILDLRTDVLNGVARPVNGLAEVKKLTDAGLAVINTYVPDGYVNEGESETNRTTINGGGTASVIVVVDHARTNFTAIYEVSKVDPELGGTIQVEPASGAAGTIVTVTAAPAEGYELETVLVDGEEIEGTTFPIRGLHTVTARFQQAGA